MAEIYYELTDIVKMIDNLIAAMPTSFYSGIMAVRGSLVTAPKADVVARGCYDRLLAENDRLRKERPVVRCGECKHFNDDDGDCRCVKDAEWDEETATWYGFVSYHMPDFFCADGERKDGSGE